MSRFSFDEDPSEEDMMEALKKHMESGEPPPDGFGFIRLQFAPICQDHAQDGWEHWFRGPLRAVFESVRSDGREFNPALFIGTKAGVLLVELDRAPKDTWIDLSHRLVKYCGDDDDSKALWVILAGDNHMVKAKSPEQAKEAVRHLTEHGSLKDFPGATEALVVHVEFRTPSGLKRSLLELPYTVKDGEVLWDDEPGHCNPVKDGTGRFAKSLFP